MQIFNDVKMTITRLNFGCFCRLLADIQGVQNFQGLNM